MTPPSSLARFQDAFSGALLAPQSGASPEVAALVAQPAFAVYRNTVIKGCIDALQANYPAVARLTGEEWFRAAAAVYVCEALPTDPVLLNYGAEFPGFLRRFEPAAGMSYLPGVAQLDRLWTEAHTAPDEKALEPGAVADLPTETLACSILRPHAAARWAWFADAPIYTIWSRNRADDVPPADLDWRPEGALLVRPRDAVQWMVLDAAGCAFLDVCAFGGTLVEAAEAALHEHGDADLAELMASLLDAGALACLRGGPQRLLSSA